jgi:prepilin-type N-terminal cleavage/methylation domain-containing protein
MENIKRDKGFSMIELLMVVTIIGIISAFAVPALQRARQQAQAASAIQSLKVVGSGQLLYERKYTTYGTFTELLSENVLESQVASGKKSEYAFTLVVGGTGKSFTVVAEPTAPTPQSDFFFMDESGVIRFNKGSSANVNSPPIPK